MQATLLLHFFLVAPALLSPRGAAAAAVAAVAVAGQPPQQRLAVLAPPSAGAFPPPPLPSSRCSAASFDALAEDGLWGGRATSFSLLQRASSGSGGGFATVAAPPQRLSAAVVPSPPSAGGPPHFASAPSSTSPSAAALLPAAAPRMGMASSSGGSLGENEGLRAEIAALRTTDAGLLKEALRAHIDADKLQVKDEGLRNDSARLRADTAELLRLNARLRHQLVQIRSRSGSSNRDKLAGLISTGSGGGGASTGSARKPLSAHTIMGVVAISGLSLVCVIFVGLKVHDFVTEAEDEDSDGHAHRHVHFKDLGQKIRRQCFCNLSPGSMWSLLSWLLVAAAGMYYLWLGGVLKQVAKQLALYGYLLLLALGLVSLFVQELWGDISEMQAEVAKVGNFVRNAFEKSLQAVGLGGEGAGKAGGGQRRAAAADSSSAGRGAKQPPAMRPAPRQQNMKQ